MGRQRNDCPLACGSSSSPIRPNRICLVEAYGVQMTATHVVYDPPIFSLPYFAVVFRPNGTLRVRAFKSARAADTYAARMLRQAMKLKRQNKPA